MERPGRAVAIAVGVIMLLAGLAGTGSAAPKPVVGISRAQSRALVTVPGALLNTTLDRDSGTLVYNVVIESVGGIRDVEVEAQTGKILRITALYADPELSREVEAP